METSQVRASRLVTRMKSDLEAAVARLKQGQAQVDQSQGSDQTNSPDGNPGSYFSAPGTNSSDG